MTDSILHSLEDLREGRHVLTIGSFDGVHRGHQYLLEQVNRSAKQHGLPSLAITFDPLPAEVLRPDKAPPRLCTIEERIDQILKCGIDRVVVLTFTPELANRTASDFLDDVVSSAQPAEIIVGEDFAFGYKRQGTPEFLAERAAVDGFELQVIERVNPEIELSSSSVRRSLIERGDVGTASQILGRSFRLAGTVTNGAHRGRDLGYPTANIEPPERMVVPADGIYAAVVDDESPDRRPSLVYIGTRPTFGDGARIIEVFLLDYSGDLYGRRIGIEFIDRIRGDRAFGSADELVNQMKQDELAGRQIFADLGIIGSVSDQ